MLTSNQQESLGFNFLNNNTILQFGYVSDQTFIVDIVDLRDLVKGTILPTFLKNKMKTLI